MTAKRPYDIMQAVQCHCVPPNRCDCTEARVHATEMTATFNLRWDADMRAIKRWHTVMRRHKFSPTCDGCWQARELVRAALAPSAEPPETT